TAGIGKYRRCLKTATVTVIFFSLLHLPQFILSYETNQKMKRRKRAFQRHLIRQNPSPDGGVMAGRR
ncbi:hypothetical protein NF717_12405, partial [Lactococcus formosensis]